MLKTVVLATLLAVCLAVPVDRPSYTFGYGDQDGVVAQFYSGGSGPFVYNWGYQYPGQAHSESMSTDGRVTGSYVYTDANGVVQMTNYVSDPVNGFTVDQSSRDVVIGVPSVPESAVYPSEPIVFSVNDKNEVSITPQVVPAEVASVPKPVVVPQPVAVAPVQKVEPEPLQYTQQQYQHLAQQGIPLDSGSEQIISRASPSLLSALRAGQLEPIIGYSDQIVFRVANSLVDDTKGSVTALAEILDVETVAPQHDQKVPIRPEATFYSAASRSAPIELEEEVEKVHRAYLDTDVFTDGMGYIVRVPFN